MAAGHMNYKRVMRRIWEELDSTRQIAKLTSWGDALATFRAKVDIQIMNHNGYKESESFKKNLLKKHEVMMHYFEQSFESFVSSYDFDKVHLIENSEYPHRVWVCWWQGEEQAPDLVKECIASIRRNLPNHTVVVITEKNYKDYTDFPKWIEEKKRKGIISRTHYSDLLRLELLARHGGTWIDSTFFCTGSEMERYCDWPLWSIKRPDYFHASVACGYFANYSLGCDFEHRKVFAVIRDFAFQYWKTNDKIIDYLFLDYLIVLVQRHFEEIAKAFELIQPNNPCCDELYKIMAMPYDEQTWTQLKEKTFMFKLSWKMNYPKEVNGQKTFYGKLLDSELC